MNDYTAALVAVMGYESRVAVCEVVSDVFHSLLVNLFGVELGERLCVDALDWWADDMDALSEWAEIQYEIELKEVEA